MESNLQLDGDNKSTSQPRFSKKKYLLVKIPANVKNPQEAVQKLGGKDQILAKSLKNEDIEINLLYKKIRLEKCVSNDLLIRRKRLRNKHNKNEYKYTYEIIGKVDSQYDFFTLHDFIYCKPDEIVGIKDLESKDEYSKAVSDESANNITAGQSSVWKNKILNSMIAKRIKEINFDSLNLDYIISFLQPDRITSGCNTYPRNFKDIKAEFKLDSGI